MNTRPNTKTHTPHYLFQQIKKWLTQPLELENRATKSFKSRMIKKLKTEYAKLNKSHKILNTKD